MIYFDWKKILEATNGNVADIITIMRIITYIFIFSILVIDGLSHLFFSIGHSMIAIETKNDT